MSDNKIKLSLTDACSQVLHAYGINPESYGPAFDGESVGLDLYNCGPELTLTGKNKWVAFDEPATLIPTGVKIALPPNTVALVKERGSVIKTGLFVRAGVIDPGYTGEIFVNLVNLGERDTLFPTGVRLPVQLIVVPCYTKFDVISNLEYLEVTKKSIRKEGAIGSSDSQLLRKQKG
jgi:dUTPase